MRRLISSLLWAQSNKKFCSRFNFFNNVYFKWPFEVFYNHGFYVAKDKNDDSIFFSDQRRARQYSNGIRSRLKYLQDVYLVNELEIEEGEVVIDCGANIGEFGLGLRAKIEYHSFEPSLNEFNCLIKNNPLNGKHNNLALWKEKTELKFYLKSDTADSSLIPIKDFTNEVIVKTISLDEYAKVNNLDKIKLIKLEAEGAEPEILLGSLDSLKRTAYISVDCGHERGVEEESTLPEVTKILINSNFEMKKVSKHRLVVLFKNKSID